jgi:hypothetical protein
MPCKNNYGHYNNCRNSDLFDRRSGRNKCNNVYKGNNATLHKMENMEIIAFVSIVLEATIL